MCIIILTNNINHFIFYFVQIGFKTPLGVFTIAGLHVLPVWLYGYQHGVLTNTFYIPEWFQGLGLMLLAAGRLLCMSVEVSTASCFSCCPMRVHRSAIGNVCCAFARIH